MNTKFKSLVCPKCKANLEWSQDTLSCPSCKINFPVINDNIVPLFIKPKLAVATAYFALHQASAGWQNRANRLGKALKTSERKKSLLPILKAFNDNQKFFKSWMKKIQNFVKPNVLIDTVKQNNSNQYGYNYNYLSRDWSDKDKRNELQHIQASLNKALAEHKTCGNACFLGVGTGRFAVELADKFDETWGLDSSFGQVAQFYSVLEESVDFWQVNTKNSTDSQHRLKKINATIPDKLKDQAHKVNYIWADTLNAPFKDAYFDWILSIYFTDVKPLPELVKELKRLLKPKGYFLHFGPLEYHFPKIELHYAYDEFKQYFIDHGFEIVYDTSAIPAQLKYDEKSTIQPQRYVEKVLLLRLKNE